MWQILRQDRPGNADRVQAIGTVIDRNTDTELLGRLALGRLWRRLSDEQRRRYSERFTAYVRQTLASQLIAAAGDMDGRLENHFRLLDSEAAGDEDMIVHTEIVRSGGRPATVDWRLRSKDGTFAIIDLLVDGVSLLVTKRSEFATVIERGSIADLLAQLKSSAGY